MYILYNSTYKREYKVIKYNEFDATWVNLFFNIYIYIQVYFDKVIQVLALVFLYGLWIEYMNEWKKQLE
jgi:hypothetical protein